MDLHALRPGASADDGKRPCALDVSIEFFPSLERGVRGENRHPIGGSGGGRRFSGDLENPPGISKTRPPAPPGVHKTLFLSVLRLGCFLEVLWVVLGVVLEVLLRSLGVPMSPNGGPRNSQGPPRTPQASTRGPSSTSRGVQAIQISRPLSRMLPWTRNLSLNRCKMVKSPPSVTCRPSSRFLFWVSFWECSSGDL